MKRIIALFCSALLLLFSQCASAETLLLNSDFQLTLPDEWNIMDESLLSQISSFLPEAAQQNASIAYSDTGNVLCAFARPSEGMTMELMALFQSAYITRIEKALSFFDMEDVLTGATAFGSNKFFYIAFTVLDTPIWVCYHFSGASVITVCTIGMELAAVNSILSTLTAIQSPPSQQ